MKSGPLNRRVTIQTRTAGVDAAGQPALTWSNLVTVWADIRGATGMGAIRASEPRDGVAVELNSYSIRIRYRTGLDAGMRVLAGGEVFDVKQVRMDMAGREWTDLVCEVGGNDG